LLSLASVTPKANFLKRKERKPLACPAPDSARICCPQTESSAKRFKRFALGQATNSALATQGRELTAFLRRHSLQTEKSLKPYSTHILPGHAIPCGWLLGWLAMGRRSSL
jgi:hypothetical protein